MITQDQVQSLIGSTAYDRSGDKVGKIGTVYYDDQTQEPKWLTVHTGLFGTNESFVPLAGAEVRGNDMTLAFEKAQIKDAPNVSSDAHLSVQEEEELYRYYGLEYGSGGVAGGDYDRTDTERTVTGTADRGTTTDYDRSRGHDTSGPNTDNAMTRSEERLNVGTETREAGRARLRKHVVTEHQQVQVPVSREEVRVEREPITDANRGDAYAGAAITEEEHEVTLHEERPVVDKEAVAVERVRLGTETVTETETVGGEVRREEIEVEDEVTRDRGRDRR
ncbi:MAG TPA: PRC and DUF2382 domain-containing protein [Pseudonocardia sp.]|nr:PRC and DUF2382 domain-containing protein [Pseudonocardia sp.]